MYDTEEFLYPRHWSVQIKNGFDKKSRVEKLAIAGALIAAEIDILQRGH